MILSRAYPLVSVIILNYNGKDCLKNCVTSVLKTQYARFEIILVDNASTDNSLEEAKTLFGNNPKLTIIKSNVNLGFSGGNNLGFEHSNGEYIVFLNNDTTVDPNWLTALVNAMENDPSIGIAQSLIFSIDGQKIQSAGWLFSNYLIRKYPLYADQPISFELEPVFDVSFTCGASMIVRREILDAMGAFEPKVPFFYDDTLLSLKTTFLGKRVVTVSDSKVYHIGGATNVWKIRFTTFHLFKSKTILQFDIYYRRADLAKALLFNLFYAVSNSVFCIGKRNVDAVIGSVDALAWSLRNMRFLWRNRLDHWSKAVTTPDALQRAFVRVNLPTALYLFPSKLGDGCFNHEVNIYEKKIKRRA
jgi:GT2 family glycosyltransferase